MGCSFRVAFHDERFDDYAGEVSFTYSTASAFNDWLFEEFGLPDDFAANERSDLMRFLDEWNEQKEYTPTFVHQIAARFPDADATPFPGIMRLFLEAAASGVPVHCYQ
jgi:hypothetical protein